jgi:ribosomal-protein-alanine N-acetyltransferase
MPGGPISVPNAISANDYEGIRAVSELHGLCFDKSWTFDDFHNFLSEQRTFLFTYGSIAFPDGMILARVAADEAEVLTLCVRPASRRQGVGEKLIRSAMVKAAEIGATRLFLEVSAENLAARNLYQLVGFIELARRRNYYGVGSDAIILTRNIY